MRCELLDQTKLDVAEKTRSNIFNWRGQFTPQFIEYLIDEFAQSEGLVIDPFCGSGTVLLEAAAKGLPAVGCEINPAAYAMSKFTCFANKRIEERLALFERVNDEIHKFANAFRGLPLFGESDDYREKCTTFIEFAQWMFAAMKEKNEVLLALIVLMRAEATGGGELLQAINKASSSIKSDLINLPFAEKKIAARLCDARETHTAYGGLADLIITSPPYINVFNYHQNYRALLEVLGFDLLKVAESEIGSNRKNRGNRFRTVIQYALDMEQSLASFARALEPGRYLIMVVGHESNVRGIPFSNSAIIRDLASSLNCFQMEGERYRVFTNRFGKAIREDILVMSLLRIPPLAGEARGVAMKHLQDAFRGADGDRRNDISQALAEVSTINPSPILTRKGQI